MDATPRETATLAGGCFWCLEAAFQQLRGVERVRSGYTGGSLQHPTYEQVCGGDTGHAEAVEIVFDPRVLSYPDLLDVFFAIHDPTTLNRQGADVGPQYRSAIFHHSPAQEAAARAALAAQAASGAWPRPLVTELAPAGVFYPAEPYHDDYYRRNPQQPYCQVVIAPKLARLRRSFAERLGS